MASRSATVKQFLLRVHPDHFRRVPKAHDENMRSMQLLNQFMDEQATRLSPQRWTSTTTDRTAPRIFFHAYVPGHMANNSQAHVTANEHVLKRFPLRLTSALEVHMQRILLECGVQLIDPPAESMEEHHHHHHHYEQEEEQQYYHDPQEAASGRHRNSMDFGHDAAFQEYARTHSSRRRKRVLVSMRDFTRFVSAPETLLLAQQRRHAWRAIQRIRHRLCRECGLQELATSCGWATLPLHAVLVALSKTLPQCVPGVLHGVRLDVHADDSEIDVDNEYTVALNVADVPVQWLATLERIDPDMQATMRSARASLRELQEHAEKALGHGEMRVLRGRTCSALAYRGFLQDAAAMASYARHDPHRPQQWAFFHRKIKSDSHELQQEVTLVVEDLTQDCVVLPNGDIRVPSTASAVDVVEFVDASRHLIHTRKNEYARQQERFDDLARQCVHALQLHSLTFAPELDLDQVIAASAALLATHQQQTHTTPRPGMNTSSSRKPDPSSSHVPQVAMGSLAGLTIRIDRSYGLAQDGVFTIPLKWHLHK